MTHSLDFFDRIYIINLPHRADRRKEVNYQLQLIGLSLDYPSMTLFPAVRPSDAGGFTSIGARGCFMSHLGVLKDAESNQYKRILILEDDVDFSEDFKDRFTMVLDILNKNKWSMFYGGYDLCDEDVTGNVVTSVSSEVAIQTCHFIGFQGDVIRKMIQHLESILTRPPGDPEGGPMHVDGAYNWYRRANPGDGTLIAVPELGHQRPSRTDIHDLRWYDKWFLLRDISQQLRAVKRKLLRLGAF